MRILTAVFLSCSACLAATSGGAKTEIGEMNGAKFRIDVPANWNGSLVIYCHGYSAEPVAYKEGKLPPFQSVFTEQGFALAQSGYAAGGWAVQEAVIDTESLRRYFSGKYGKPKEVFVTGHSMGGFLTMMLVERFPDTYTGGFAMCGPLAPTNYFMARGAFDARVVFDYFFPGALPAPDKVPADYHASPAENKRITDLLETNPEKAGQLRKYTGAKNDHDIGNTMPFITFVLGELQRRGGGNPFDNRDVIYEGVDDYNALNRGVKRYSADPRAAEYVRDYYTPTGKLSRPLLAVHTTYDPLVPVRIPNMYPAIVQRAGTADMFVQQFVEHDGHCSILPQETAKGFNELLEWTSKGVRPTPGPLNGGN